MTYRLALAAAVQHLLALDWDDHPDTAHERHRYDMWCAICRGRVADVLAAIPDDDLLAILEERGVLVREHAFSIVDTQQVEKARMARFVSAPRPV